MALGGEDSEPHSSGALVQGNSWSRRVTKSRNAITAADWWRVLGVTTESCPLCMTYSGSTRLSAGLLPQ